MLDISWPLLLCCDDSHTLWTKPHVENGPYLYLGDILLFEQKESSIDKQNIFNKELDDQLIV